MAKKRQADFPKTQLKPGRTLSRRRNVTNTSFKTKKIVMPSKRHGSQKSELTISDCLKAVKSGFTSSRITALNRMNDMITNQTESFFLSIAEVLESVAKLILESDDNLRNAALKVIKSILENTDDLKIFSFIPLLTNVLSCAMTHAVHRIKENSLNLLDCMLKTHPDLICNSLIILKNLLHMISGSPRKRTHSQSAKHKSSLVVNYSDSVYSQDWRINVLGHLNLFFKEMLKNFEKNLAVEDDRDEQEVYWNCEGPLYLEIYASGGLKPIDIENSYFNTFSSQELYFADPDIVDFFIIPIVTLIFEVFLEEIAGGLKADDSLLHRETIDNLSILFQVLSRLTEWMKLISYDEVDKLIGDFLRDKVCGNRFPFHPRGSVFDAKAQNLPCVQLNLAVCFLYSKFLLETECDKVKFSTSIFSYIKRVFDMSYEVRYDSIPMLVKILKIYYGMTQSPDVLEFIVNSLFHMSSLIKVNDDRPNIKLLLSLFVKLSLDPAYHFLAETDAMKNWFIWLLTRLVEIPKSGKVDKKLLNVTKKIANRKYPSFLEALAGIDNNVIKGLLKYDDDDVRDTVNFLIYCMKDISASLLEDITNVILVDSSFPTRFAVRLIRLLTYRFTEKPQSADTDMDIYRRGRVDFTQFLLNIAIDSLNMNNEKWIDYEANEYTRAMKEFKDVTAYNIFPSLHWKKHSVLFEVCHKSLSLLPKKIVNGIATIIFKEILDGRNLPMHCAIAMWKLNNHKMDERYYRLQIYDFIFSSLFTTSVLTYMSAEDEWYRWNVVELMNSMELNRRSALETIRQLEYDKSDEISGITAYHILRICKFYLERQLLQPEDSKSVLNTFECLKEKCSEKTLEQQPLFIQLHTYFGYYM